MARSGTQGSAAATGCRIAAGAFAALYLAAAALFVIGRYGLFGTEPGPLAGVFLIPLGLPWIWLVDAFPEPLWPWLGLAAPAVNLVLIRLLCGRLGRRGAAR